MDINRNLNELNDLVGEAASLGPSAVAEAAASAATTILADLDGVSAAHDAVTRSASRVADRAAAVSWAASAYLGSSTRPEIVGLTGDRAAGPAKIIAPVANLDAVAAPMTIDEWIIDRAAAIAADGKTLLAVRHRSRLVVYECGQDSVSKFRGAVPGPSSDNLFMSAAAAALPPPEFNAAWVSAYVDGTQRERIDMERLVWLSSAGLTEVVVETGEATTLGDHLATLRSGLDRSPFAAVVHTPSLVDTYPSPPAEGIYRVRVRGGATFIENEVFLMPVTVGDDWCVPVSGFDVDRVERISTVGAVLAEPHEAATLARAAALLTEERAAESKMVGGVAAAMVAVGLDDDTASAVAAAKTRTWKKRTGKRAVDATDDDIAEIARAVPTERALQAASDRSAIRRLVVKHGALAVKVDLSNGGYVVVAQQGSTPWVRRRVGARGAWDEWLTAEEVESNRLIEVYASPKWLEWPSNVGTFNLPTPSERALVSLAHADMSNLGRPLALTVGPAERTYDGWFVAHGDHGDTISVARYSWVNDGKVRKVYRSPTLSTVNARAVGSVVPWTQPRFARRVVVGWGKARFDVDADKTDIDIEADAVLAAVVANAAAGWRSAHPCVTPPRYGVGNAHKIISAYMEITGRPPPSVLAAATAVPIRPVGVDPDILSASTK